MRLSMPSEMRHCNPMKATGGVALVVSSGRMRSSVPTHPVLGQSRPLSTTTGFVSERLTTPTAGQPRIPGKPLSVTSGVLSDAETWGFSLTSALPFQSCSVTLETPHCVKSAEQSMPTPLALGARRRLKTGGGGRLVVDRSEEHTSE